MDLRQLTSPIVQISLDLTDLDEALTTAQIAVDAGVDWLEAGTPLIQAAGRPPSGPCTSDSRRIRLSPTSRSWTAATARPS